MSKTKKDYNIYVITKRFKDKCASLKFYTAKSNKLKN